MHARLAPIDLLTIPILQAIPIPDISRVIYIFVYQYNISHHQLQLASLLLVEVLRLWSKFQVSTPEDLACLTRARGASHIDFKHHTILLENIWRILLADRLLP